MIARPEKIEVEVESVSMNTKAKLSAVAPLGVAMLIVAEVVLTVVPCSAVEGRFVLSDWMNVLTKIAFIISEKEALVNVVLFATKPTLVFVVPENVPPVPLPEPAAINLTR